MERFRRTGSPILFFSPVFFIHIFLFVVFSLTLTCDANLMGVDFGSSFLKVSIARPGKGIELVTNEQSKRKTPAAVGFTPEGERLFGDAALSYAAKAPDRVILYGRDFLGACKDICDADAMKCMKEDTNEKGRKRCEKIVKKVEGIGEFRGEHIAAMLLGLARKQAAVALGGKGNANPKVIKDAVITIPPWFSTTQRGELLDAAELIGLNVLSLLHTPTAAALKYALDNKGMKAMIDEGDGEKKAGSTIKQKVLIYDMGASSATATIAEITSNVKQKRATRVAVLSHGSTKAISGRALDAILVDKLCSDFDSQRSEASERCAGMPRVLVRLRKAAQRAREILSANADTIIHVPSLYEDQDFKTTLQRSDFETTATKLFADAEEPVRAALTSASLSASNVHAVVPVGGASRTPKVQEGLLKATAREVLNKSLNADEAAVLGAAYFAASLSSTFRVREIAVHDVLPYSISARIDRDKKKSGLFSRGDSNPVDNAQVVRIFEVAGKMPARKSVTLKRSGDFGVTVFLEDGNDTLLSKFQVTNINKVLKKVSDKKLADSMAPKVSLAFQLDSSGMIKVIAAEAAVDESITVTYTPSPSPTLSRDPEASGTAEDKGEKKKTIESPSQKPSPTTKVQTVVHREAVSIAYDKDAISAASGRLSGDEKKAAAEFLHSLEAADLERVRIADALNSLESEVLTVRSKVREAHEASEDEDDEQILILRKVSTPEERAIVLETCNSIEDWIFSEGSRKLADILKEKSTLTRVTEDMFLRAAEHKRRPEAITTLQTALKNMRTSAEPLRQLHEERKSSHIPSFDKFSKALSEAEEWLNGKLAEQEKLSPTEKPAFSTADIKEKSKKLFVEFASLGRLKVPDSPAPSPSTVLKEGKQRTESIENETAKGANKNSESKDEPKIDAGGSAKADAGGIGDVKDEL